MFEPSHDKVKLKAQQRITFNKCSFYKVSSLKHVPVRVKSVSSYVLRKLGTLCKEEPLTAFCTAWTTNPHRSSPCLQEET